MNLKEILKTINDNTLAVAKALQEEDTEQAVDLLTKQAEQVKELIEKAEEEQENEDTPPSPTEPEVKEEPVEKTVLSLTKQQETLLTKFTELSDTGIEALIKFVEMYISAGDGADFVEQFSDIKDRVSKIEKSSKQDPEDIEKTEKSSLSGILSV